MKKKLTRSISALFLALAIILAMTLLTVFATGGSDRGGAIELSAGQSDSFAMPSFMGDGWYKFNLSAASKVDITISIENNEVNSQAGVVGGYYGPDSVNQMPAYVGVTGAPLGDRTQERSFPVGIEYGNNVPSRTGTYYLAEGWWYINVAWTNMNDKEHTSPQVTIKIDSIDLISNTGGLTRESARTVDPSKEIVKQSRFEHDDWEIGHFYYTFTLLEAAEVSIKKSVELAPSKDERINNNSELWLNSASDSFTSIWGKVDGKDVQRLQIYEKRDNPLTQTITYELQAGIYYVVLYNAWAYTGTEYTLTFSMNNGASAPGIDANMDSASDWAKAGLSTAIEAGLVPESLQSSYKQATTRAEFAALAVTLYETLKGEITERMTFSDTDDVNVQKAAAIGVVNGVGNNNFNPDGALTREQAATMLARLANTAGKPIPLSEATFSDNAAVSSWASDAVGQMQASEIMGGVGGNMFSPAGPYTREQSIVTILRLFDYLNSD